MDFNAQHRLVYDQLADDYEARVPALRPVTLAGMRRLADFLQPAARVLDVGCGPGAAIQVLSELGYQASGIDLSPRMTALASKRNPHSEIFTGDLLAFPFSTTYDAIIAFAFIHLFPSAQVPTVLGRLHDLLTPLGILYVGTSRSTVSTEGWTGKADYPGAPLRYRKHWQPEDFEQALTAAHFAILDQLDHIDPFGKTWMDYILQAQPK